MNMTKTALLTSALLLTSSLYAETGTVQAGPDYGDNPNIFKVLALKTQASVQNTAEKVGAATERGIAKIKPSIDNTWNGTKEYTTEQAVIARDNTREGIDTAVKKVKQTKENIVGTSAPNNVPIQKGNLSQDSGTMQQSTSQYAVPQQSTPQYIEPTVVNTAPVIQNTAPTSPTLNQNTSAPEAEIQRQSLPIQNSSPDDSDAGLPR